MARDISRKQFRARMESYGFRSHGVMGYWSLPVPFDNTSVSEWNGGESNRARLAYMLREWEKTQKVRGAVEP